MSEPDLDLTQAAEAAGQALYEANAASLLKKGTDLAALPPWESLRPIEQHHFRALALPVVLACVPPIARQAWDLGQLVESAEQVNPWLETDWDEALRNL